jgi:hypothetical protein
MNEFGALIKEILRWSAQKNLRPSEVAEAIVEKNCITNHQRMFSQFWKRKYIIQWLARTSVVQQAMPKLQAWASLQNQQRIFAENRKYLQD